MSTFSPELHKELLRILAASDYIADYVRFADSYPAILNGDDRKIDTARLSNIFRISDPQAKWDKNWRMFDFGKEEI